MSRVLLAEPDPALHRLLAVWLNGLGHVTLSSDPGFDLAGLCSRYNADVVILSAGAANRGGLDVAEAVRRASAIPIILTSGGWRGDLLDRAHALGAIILAAPFGRADLAAAVALAAATPIPDCGGWGWLREDGPVTVGHLPPAVYDRLAPPRFGSAGMFAVYDSPAAAREDSPGRPSAVSGAPTKRS